MDQFAKRRAKRKPRSFETKTTDSEEKLTEKYNDMIYCTNRLTDHFDRYMKEGLSMKKVEFDHMEEKLHMYIRLIDEDISFIREQKHLDTSAGYLLFIHHHPLYENVIEETLNGSRLVEEGIAMMHARMEGEGVNV